MQSICTSQRFLPVVQASLRHITSIIKPLRTWVDGLIARAVADSVRGRMHTCTCTRSCLKLIKAKESLQI